MNKSLKVALIGRANVGKSTLFNKLTEERKALVSKIAGTTRDRNYAPVNWNNSEFVLIDTGGLDAVHATAFAAEIIKQTKVALSEADLAVLVVDRHDGLMPADKTVAGVIRKSGKKTIVAVNKADTPRQKKDLNEYYALGFEEILPVSALNGSGTGDLLDKIIASLPKKHPKKTLAGEQKTLRLAIIGKPNVGKSSLVNAILGEERVIVSPAPFTTRDSQEIFWTYKNHDFVLIDTAGVRRQNKIADSLEKISVKQALHTIESADVTLLVTDVSLPLTNQDQQLANYLLQSKSSIIIVANKWDLVPSKNPLTINRFIDYYQRYLPFLAFCPIVVTSALEKKRVTDILDLAHEVYEARFKMIEEADLETLLRSAVKKQMPGKGKGTKKPRLYQLKQLAVNPPEFELIKDWQSDLHPSYIRFLENQLRQKHGFLGSPIIFKMRKLAK